MVFCAGLERVIAVERFKWLELVFCASGCSWVAVAKGAWSGLIVFA